MDAYFRQLEPAMRAAADPLARDPMVLEWFELARGCLHAYFDSADDQEERAYVATVHAMTSLVVAARTAAPVLAELQGDAFPRQVFEWVRYRVLEDRGAGDAAEAYEAHAPRAIASRPDLRTLRERLRIPHPIGATPGHELVDDRLRTQLAQAADGVARKHGKMITVTSLAKAIGMDATILRKSIRQSGIGEAKDVARALRNAYGQRLRRGSK